ncbi:SHOCT domain-containing protein [Prescottella subtropica]|uniref:SHOCT domain-containing protein n=1 Tax=Prescottella subtropica TaxID=2545757 RepID=UPI001F4FB0BF|nr:SHOCT domain-containing protein [Prescottella subtropica]
MNSGAFGRIIEYDDGTAAYKRPMEFSHAFRVRVADVTGFSVERGKKMLQRRLLILGNGTTLATADVAHGVAEQIEGWFRAHKDFGGNRGSSAAAPIHTSPQPGGQSGPSLIADELMKLAGLRDQGILTDAEFESQKAKLLAR